MTKKPKVVACIQARMRGSRLPGKVLADIEGRPMLWHVVRRIRAAEQVDHVVVATSTERADDAIAEFCVGHGIDCFRGSEIDVLDRLYRAASQYEADAIVRITADCPLIDPVVVDKVIRAYLDDELDYVANTLLQSYPDGLDVEVFSFAALEKVWRSTVSSSDREHVTMGIRTSGNFRLGNVESAIDFSARAMRWTVDEPRDLAFVRAVYSRIGADGARFGLEDVLRLIDKEPWLGEMNKGIVRNEGYYKSLATEPPVPARARSLDNSVKLKARAERVIPSCTQTFSKGPTQFVQGVSPVFLMRGEGSHVWDVDGNEYIDYPMALGPIILGHNYPAVTVAACQQIEEGVTFSLPHPIEVEVAEQLVQMIPCAEMVRFGKNGSDATSGAVRVARAYTGRDVIACCGYHGWQDWFIGSTTRNLGVPTAVRELTKAFQYNDVASLKKIFADHPAQVAAVIMEPIGVEEPRDGFLESVRDLARENGAVLIFDEVVTGFRLALGGAQEYFGVIPDLACVGKGMANGYPIAALVGRRDIMELFDEVFFSFTFGGEAVSLAATLATTREILDKGVIEVLWDRGQKLKDGYNVLAREFRVDRYTECIGLAPRTVMTFRDESGNESSLVKSLFQQECLKRGVLFSGSQLVCYTHTDADIEYTLRVYRTALEILADAIGKGDVGDRLEGAPVQPVFRRA